MIIFLPFATDGLAEFERSISPAKMEEWLSRLQLQPMPEVELTLPKYKMTAKFDLNKELADMGIRRAFDASTADFSGMNGQRTLHIGFVVHKAYIGVSEEGTEAAAATATGTFLVSAAIYSSFRADHPFVFMIRENRSGAILFMGRALPIHRSKLRNAGPSSRWAIFANHSIPLPFGLVVITPRSA